VVYAVGVLPISSFGGAYQRKGAKKQRAEKRFNAEARRGKEEVTEGRSDRGKK
jgi:hypothetical protein